MSIITMSMLCVLTGNAQINDSTSLPEVEVSRLSQRDPNSLGEKALAVHQPFETALPRAYAGKFSDPSVLEQKFREYAAKDFGTALQQPDDQ